VAASDGTNLDRVNLRTDAPIVRPGPTVRYRLRAANSAGTSPPSAEQAAARIAGPPTLQWQRTEANTSAGPFVDLPGATGPVAADASLPGGGARRWYRLRVTAAGITETYFSTPDVGWRANPCNSCNAGQTVCANEEGKCDRETGCCGTAGGCSVILAVSSCP
jgi:hypothetical protein